MSQIFSSINPSDGTVLWQGKSASEQEIDEILARAKQAFGAWSTLSPDQRFGYIESFCDKLLAAEDDPDSALSYCIARETGKALWECKLEIKAMTNKAKITREAFAERSGYKEKLLGANSSNAVKPEGQTYSRLRHRPHGLLAVFGPYNFPGHVSNGHIMPALLAGNVVVLKPSELTPLCAQRMCELWSEAGLPAGVLSLVQGELASSKYLAQHSDLDGLLFTGSSATGTTLHRSFAGQPEKILSLEMGGNNPLLIWDCADLEAAAYLTIQSAFISTGQRCTCARRLIVEDSLAEDFISKLVDMSSRFKIGKAFDEDIFCGPLVSEAQVSKVLAAQIDLVTKGAKILLEAKALEPGTGLISPGILDVTGIELEELQDCEVFGPLLKVYRVKDFASAIKEANNTSYGLSAGLISDSQELYDDFVAKVQAGIINWNQQLTGASSEAPFGGIGLSGNHRPTAYYAADYCSYPVASLENSQLKLPENLSPGF